MLKRSLIFTSPASLSLRLGQVVIRLKAMPDEVRTVPIEDIGLLMIDHPQVSLTMPLLNALTAEQVAVVLCNEKGMPSAMLQPLDTHTTQGETLQSQLSATEPLKKQLWKQLVEAKIRNQAALLSDKGKRGERLRPCYQNVLSGDTTNREGMAAKLYWSMLFGKDFVRDRQLPGINAMLNYGYTVLRAAVARAIMASGLFPALGLFHHNRANAFPLADDLMEPYRVYVDDMVYELWENGECELTPDVRHHLVTVLTSDTHFPEVVRPLSVGLTMTTASLVKCLNREIKTLSLPSYR